MTHLSYRGEAALSESIRAANRLATNAPRL